MLCTYKRKHINALITAHGDITYKIEFEKE